MIRWFFLTVSYFLFIILTMFIYGIKHILSVEAHLWIGVEEFFPPI